MVAAEMLLLLQEPPPETSENVVVRPEQTLLDPEITDGKGLTVKVAVFIQPKADE
jgi:hypothetical protein